MSHDYIPSSEDANNQIMQAIAILRERQRMVDNAPKRFAPEPDRNFKVHPALCLDLDDTVRHSASGKFINGAADVCLYPDAEAKLWEYRDQGYLIVGVSNQGGVAFGHKTSQDVNAEVEAMLGLFKRNPFHAVKYCMHDGRGSVVPFNHRSMLRKPDIGMLALIEVEAFQAGYIIDWDKSLMVGDRPEDAKLAENAGIEFRWAYEFFDRPVNYAERE